MNADIHRSNQKDIPFSTGNRVHCLLLVLNREENRHHHPLLSIP